MKILLIDHDPRWIESVTAALAPEHTVTTDPAEDVGLAVVSQLEDIRQRTPTIFVYNSLFEIPNAVKVFRSHPADVIKKTYERTKIRVELLKIIERLCQHSETPNR